MVKRHGKREQTVRPKRRWWQWVALGLMLLAIGTYVLTLDDAVVPEMPAGTEAPPAAGR